MLNRMCYTKDFAKKDISYLAIANCEWSFIQGGLKSQVHPDYRPTIFHPTQQDT